MMYQAMQCFEVSQRGFKEKPGFGHGDIIRLIKDVAPCLSHGKTAACCSRLSRQRGFLRHADKDLLTVGYGDRGPARPQTFVSRMGRVTILVAVVVTQRFRSSYMSRRSGVAAAASRQIGRRSVAPHPVAPTPNF